MRWCLAILLAFVRGTRRPTREGPDDQSFDRGHGRCVDNLELDKLSVVLGMKKKKIVTVS